MTERTTVAFKNLNALHSYEASSDANHLKIGLCCFGPGGRRRVLGGPCRGMVDTSVSRARVECDR
jgi:hypothetical protein